MAKEIAVFVGPDGTSAMLDMKGRFVVFRRAQGAWEVVREMEMSLGDVGSMRELRQKMASVLQFLGECRVFVARAATGIPYFELEKAGCSIWEYEGLPTDFLDRVWAGEEAARAEENARKEPEIPMPEERSPGQFFISIKDVQAKNADLSSKQVLRDFIRRGGFRSLHIICGHIPPWIEIEAARSGLQLETEQPGKNEFVVRLMKKAPGA